MNGAVEAWRDAGRFFEFGGDRIFYRRQGDGPTVLLVHGYPFGSFEWHCIWDTLTANFDVIAPDMLGMGFSDKPIRSSYNLITHADMHDELLRSLGIERFATVGHDLGFRSSRKCWPDEPKTRHCLRYMPRFSSTVDSSPRSTARGRSRRSSRLRQDTS
ncbi:alpha/beta fold hydrolase [Nocardia sp. NPDC050710]|uniref:alpha/beta fold hydrolase n=1 Tax=Nocardia sp. NPDC050710 TaxID=3157220 RepID=UPI0033D737AD